MSKAQKARVIVQAMYLLDVCPHEDTSFAVISRQIKQEARKSKASVNERYKLALSILSAEEVLAELS